MSASDCESATTLSLEDFADDAEPDEDESSPAVPDVEHPASNSPAIPSEQVRNSLLSSMHAPDR